MLVRKQYDNIFKKHLRVSRCQVAPGEERVREVHEAIEVQESHRPRTHALRHVERVLPADAIGMGELIDIEVEGATRDAVQAVTCVRRNHFKTETTFISPCLTPRREGHVVV